jgi:predicted transcriptional regulator YheO
VQKSLGELISVDHDQAPLESLRARSIGEIRAVIDQFAGQRNQTPRGLAPQEKKMVVKELKERGFLQIKNAVPNIAACLGISRATIYNYADADDR